MALGRFWKETHHIHAHSLKGNTNDWERHQQREAGVWGGVLALGAVLAEILDLCVHPQPEEVVTNFFQHTLA